MCPDCASCFELLLQSGAAPAAALNASSAFRSGFLCVPALSSRWRATSVIAVSASAPGATLRAAIGFRSGGPASSGMDVRHLGIGSCCCFESFERLSRFGVSASSGMDGRHRGIGFGSWCCFESFECLVRFGGLASSGMDIRHRGIGFGSGCCCFESFEWLRSGVPALSSVREPMWEPAVASWRATSVIAESASRCEYEMMGRCYGCCCCC